MMLGSAQTQAETPRASGNWIGQVWRLTRWDIFLVRRRMMSKVLLGILIGGFILVLAFVLLAFVSINAQSASTGTQCPPNAQGCVAPSQAQVTAQRNSQLDSIRDLVTFPQSLKLAGLYTAGQGTGLIGILLICILVGALIGSEYSFGTVRLVLVRGTSRAQMLVGQVGALAVLALGVAGGMLVLGAITGFTLGPLLGGTPGSVPAGGWGEIALFWLTLALTLFTYMSVAFFFATLGRSVAAGIGFALGYVIVELIAPGIIAILQVLTLGPQAVASGQTNWIGHISDWFISNNTGALSTRAGSGPIGLTSSDLSGVLSIGHALPVVIGYCVVLLGASYWLLRTRDVTD